MLAGHCAAIGWDVNEITCSVNVRIDPDGDLEPVVAAVTAYRDAGVDLTLNRKNLRFTPTERLERSLGFSDVAAGLRGEISGREAA